MVTSTNSQDPSITAGHSSTRNIIGGHAENTEIIESVAALQLVSSSNDGLDEKVELATPVVTKNATVMARSVTTVRTPQQSAMGPDALRIQAFVMDWHSATMSLPARTAADFYYFQGPEEWKAQQLQLRRVKNQSTPFLRLPPELRNVIYEMVTREQVRKWCARVHVKSPNKSTMVIMPPHHVNLIGACYQIRSDCRISVEGLLQVELYNPKERTWRQLSAGDVRKLRKVKVWVKTNEQFGSVVEAKARLEAVERANGSQGEIDDHGVVYFTYLPEFGARVFRKK
ncbi:hypothetical protein LTR17_003481 [Elasticomyces elasticus]|nr:hypothetical protein LTR17_003481 [Elasticomyces elasticus]